MDRGRLPVAKRTRLQMERFYREISGGTKSKSKKSKTVVEMEGGNDDNDVVFLGFMHLTNAGEVGALEGGGGAGEVAGVDVNGVARREQDCVGDVEKELDVIDVEKELNVIDVEKELMGFQGRSNGQVSERNGNAENGKEVGRFEKADESSKESSLSSSSSEEDDNLEDEDYAAEKSSSDFREPEVGEGAIDNVSSEDGKTFDVEEVHERAIGSHPSSERKKNKKNEEEKNGLGVVIASSSMWIEDEEEEGETVTLVRRSRVAKRTRSHDIEPRDGIVLEKARTGTFDNPYCLEADGAENLVTSKKSELAHKGSSPSGTAGSKTAASESMSMEYANVNDT